jgi:hypothetical protein
MGVDHTAFACYGVRVQAPQFPKTSTDELNEAIPSKLKVQFVEWGSRPYGGAWGLVLMLDESYSQVDFNEGVGVRALPSDRDWDQVRAFGRLADARDALKAAGFTVEFDKEPAWFVGGNTW